MSIIDQLKSGERARLIPILPDSKKEQKATSVLLAAFRVIPDFANAVLSEAGARIGSRAKIECYTEIVFQKEPFKNSRPDGLIVVHTGKSEWSAIVESKIGNASLSQQQLEQYLGAARDLGIDAVITISNEFAILPTHHPVPVNRNLLKKVSLYHFSWLSIISKAVLLADNSVVEDPEQAFILGELIRYLQSSNSGVSALTKMDSGWRDVCDRVQQGAPLHPMPREVEEAVGSWHQLLRYLSLRLSMATSSAVTLIIPRKLQNNPEEQLKHNVNSLTKDNLLYASFDVPNAASTIEFTADFTRRTLCLSMKLQSPQDIKRATAGINWLTRQLKDVKAKDTIAVRSHWPKRTPMTIATLSEAMEKPEVLVPAGCLDIPKEVEVSVVVDLAGRFRGSKTFIEESERELKLFYKSIGQQLSKWQPKAPQIRVTQKQNEDQVDGKGKLAGIFGDEADSIIRLPDNQEGGTFPEAVFPTELKHEDEPKAPHESSDFPVGWAKRNVTILPD